VDTLVQRLSDGQHPVEVALRPSRTIKALRDCLERRFVHIRFTNTRGGTELGVSLADDPTLTGIDLDAGRGQITLKGRLTLNYVPVECIATIDLATLAGTGYLKPLSQ
jgi:hypothetical protein